VEGTITYHVLRHNANAYETGRVFPQASFLDLEAASALRFNTFADEPPDLRFKLEPGAKLTDSLGQATIADLGLLVSERFREVLSPFRLMDHRLYETPLVSRSEPLTYYWLHLPSRRALHWIDFPRSTFWVTEASLRDHPIQFDSLEEYERVHAEQDHLHSIIIDRITLNATFDPTLDLFTLPLLSRRIFVSDRLAEEIRRQRLTGVKLESCAVEFDPIA
jgi:hypothetical protein